MSECVDRPPSFLHDDSLPSIAVTKSRKAAHGHISLAAEWGCPVRHGSVLTADAVEMLLVPLCWPT